MRIVRVGEADWQLARAIRLRSLAADPTAFASTLERELALPSEGWQDRLRSSSWFLAVPDQPADPAGLPVEPAGRAAEPVGVALIRPLAEENADYEVNAMWVAPELRGQRIGEALLDAALATVPGGRTVRLWVTVGNDGAAALYTRRGFRPTGRTEPLRSDSPLTVAEYLLTLD
jgi:ribosomal protein S18 acetylase RimI-like enzyme